MGVDLGELVEPERIEWSDLHNKELAIDAMNTLYQFLSIIRQRDGTPLKDSQGRVTSHLSGVFYRNVNLLEKNIRPVYVFDGSTPDIKQKESSRRAKKREEAREEWKKLKEEGKVEEAFTKATQSSRLNEEMLVEAKKLLDAMGIPYVEAASEGEAQAAHMASTAESPVYAVGSQDWDCMLFGASRMVRNLTTRKKQKTSGGGEKKVFLERIELEDVLEQLDVTREKLVWMGVLMGTDFNPDGVKGIGPKTAVDLVAEYDSFTSLVEEEGLEFESGNDPETIIDFFMDPPVEDADYEFSEPDSDRIRELLVEEHDFSGKRVDSGLQKLAKAMESRQSGLGSFT